MKRIKTLGRFYIVVAALTVLLLRTGGVAQAALRLEVVKAAPPPICRTWKVISCPSMSTSSNVGDYLSDVAVISPNDVWAVGFHWDSAYVSHTVTEHWNGMHWSIIASPNPGGSASNNYLGGVVALSTNNVWATGWYSNGNAAQTLIEHWDGTAWNVVPSPNIGSAVNELGGIAALSPNDIWAAGSYWNSNSHSQTLIEHWNGTSWSIVPSANSSNANLDNLVGGIAAISTNDIWTVGYTDNSGTAQALIEHWNGTNWSIVASPNPAGSNLSGIVALSTNNIWAVGFDNYNTLIEHWDGSQWSVVPSPNPGGSNTFNWLGSVAAVSANDIWAVGTIIANAGNWKTLIEHWDGSRWSSVPSPNFGNSTNQLGGVAADSANDAWTVGTSANSIGVQPLIEHWNGSLWTIVPPSSYNTTPSVHDMH